MAFHAWHDVVRDLVPNASLPAGMSRRSIVGEGGMLCLHEAFPGLVCAPHQHAAEQFSVVLTGRMRFVIAGETRVLGPGEVAHIPGGVPHAIESLDEYVQVLDVFVPHRPDILARLEQLGPGGG
jgi:quercetin dioxygenase-like cupin family protein